MSTTVMREGARSAAGVASVAAAAALAVEDVVRLSSGAVGEIATPARGERIDGVRVRPGEPTRVEVHVVVRYGARPLPLAAETVRRAVSTALEAAAVEGVVVDVRVADLVIGGEAP